MATAPPPFDPKMNPQTATTAITRRYLAAYGPATYQDLARWWSGGGVSTARQWMTALGEEVCPVELDGAPAHAQAHVQAWMLAADAREVRELPPIRSVRLLPGFDQYVVAASLHAEHMPPGDLRRHVYRPQGWISPVLLVNGLMQGTWRHAIKGSRVEVVIEPFLSLPGAPRSRARSRAPGRILRLHLEPYLEELTLSSRRQKRLLLRAHSYVTSQPCRETRWVDRPCREL